MANEVRATGTLQISANGFTITGNTTQTLSLTGSQYIGNIQSVGTAYEQVAFGDLTDVRYLYLYNQSTASIHVTVNTNSSSFAKLRPDDVLVLPPSASLMSYFVKADEGGADLQVVAVEE